MVSGECREFAAIFIVAIISTVSVRNGVADVPSTEKASNPRNEDIAKLNELIKKGSDESLNAEPCYRKAFELYIEPPAGVDPNALGLSKSTSEQQAVARGWVSTNSDALAHLRLGSQRPRYWPHYEGSDVWQTSPKEVHLSQVLGLRARLEASEGRIEEAVQDTLACCRLGWDLKKRLLLLEQARGIIILKCGLRTGFRILDQTEIDRTSLDFLQGQLVRLSQEHNLAIDLAGERLLTLSAVEKIYAAWAGSGGKENTRVFDEVISSFLADRWKADYGMDLSADQVYSSVYRHEPDQMANLIRRAYAYYGSIVLKTPFQWHMEQINWKRAAKESVEGNHLLLKLLPPIPGISEMSFRCQTERDALITTLAVLRYRKDKDRFPADLQELIRARYMSWLPMDPYSDKPLVYKRTENDFVLYSIGADFQDNDGRHSNKWGMETRGGDFVFWPVQNE